MTLGDNGGEIVELFHLCNGCIVEVRKKGAVLKRPDYKPAPPPGHSAVTPIVRVGGLGNVVVGGG